jgi:predicted SAM-dependent methyltransferase
LLAALFRNRSGHINQGNVKTKNYLDIGCGPNPHEQFINLDYGWHPQVDICWDVTKGIPLSDNAVNGIYSEHCIEHLPFESIDFVMQECHRVLQPGGTVRLIVPDGELYLTRYVHILREGSGLRLPYADGDPFDGIYSPIVSVNRIFRAHGHLFIYDFDLLQQLLQRNGFVEIKKETFGSGRDSRLLIDSESRAVESLYVEASKPLARIAEMA